MLPASDEYTIQDYECLEFTALVTLNTVQQSPYDQMVALFGLLDKHWDVNFARYRVTQVCAAAAAAAADDDERLIILL